MILMKVNMNCMCMCVNSEVIKLKYVFMCTCVYVCVCMCVRVMPLKKEKNSKRVFLYPQLVSRNSQRFRSRSLTVASYWLLVDFMPVSSLAIVRGCSFAI